MPPSVFQFQDTGCPEDSPEKYFCKTPRGRADVSFEKSAEGMVSVDMFCEVKNNNSHRAETGRRHLIVPYMKLP